MIMGMSLQYLCFDDFFNMKRMVIGLSLKRLKVKSGWIAPNGGLHSSRKELSCLPWWRKVDDPLNEKIPSENDVDFVLLEKFRTSSSRLRTFMEDFIVKLSLSES